MKLFNNSVLLVIFHVFLTSLNTPALLVAADHSSDNSHSAIDLTNNFEKSALSNNVTVFIYHRFGEDKYPSTNVTIERFAEQLDYLKSNNYNVISLSVLFELLKKGEKLPRKSVVITIDDGYKSVYEKAWPLLKSFGYPFTVFIYSKATDNKHWDYMTWEQIKELQGQGVDFQDHSYAHNRMGTIPDGMDKAHYSKWIRDDLLKSYKLIEKNLGHKPEFLALPYGEYNSTVVEVARDIGYNAVFTQDPGAVSTDTALYSIPREPILGNSWSTMEHFEMVLNRADLPVESIQPDSGLLNNSTPELYSARVLYPQRYDPRSFAIYVSELGWMPTKLDGDILRVENPAELQRRSNRVAIKAREKVTGQTAIRFWLLLKGDTPQPPADTPKF